MRSLMPVSCWVFAACSDLPAALDPAVLQRRGGERLAVIGQPARSATNARQVLEALENDSLAIGGGRC